MSQHDDRRAGLTGFQGVQLHAIGFNDPLGDGHALGVIGVALKGLARRKLRATLTAVAIVLGVAMISGTYILTDTIKSAFGTVFTQVYKNTDVVITGKSAIGGNEHNNGTTPPAFNESLLASVRTLPGVAEGRLAHP